MSFKECDFVTKILRKYIKKEDWKTSIIEAKVSAGRTLPFSKFQCHQIPTLIKVNKGQIIYKPSDLVFDLKPADIFVYNQEDSYVAILFNKDKLPRERFYLIAGIYVLALQKIPNKKSLTEDDCSVLGFECPTR